jgi:threonine synthase
MGKIAYASVLREDFTQEHYDDPDQALATGAVGRIEYCYAYGPELLSAGTSTTNGMWRYRDLLPLEDGPIMYPLTVGDTPLVAPHRLREATGVSDLWFKDETRTPTGSNKDRATALVLEHAASLAVGAAAAGVRATIFVPAEVTEAKLKLMLLAGATVLKVREGYEAAFELSQEAARAFGWYDRNTGVNPLTLEAKKTVAFEIWEQLGRRMPDAVVVPVGDGPTLSAMMKGFRELVACGASDRLPRAIGVQAEGCEPLKKAWERGGPVRSVHPQTIADGIAVGAPVSAALVLRDVRESGGGFVAVSDESMLDAIRALAATGGILAEPAGAAGLAGLRCALATGLVERGETVVVHVTGTGLKSPRYLRPEVSATEIEASLEHVERAVGSS